MRRIVAGAAAGWSRGVVDRHGCFGRGQFDAALRREVPWQELRDVFRHPAACGGAAFQRPRKPATRVQTPLLERRHNREHGGRQRDAPERAGAVIVLSADGWANSSVTCWCIASIASGNALSHDANSLVSLACQSRCRFRWYKLPMRRVTVHSLGVVFFGN